MMKHVAGGRRPGRPGSRQTPANLDRKSHSSQTLLLWTVVALAGTTACASSEAASTPRPASQAPASAAGETTVALPIGATVRLDDGTALTLRDVSDDSRCPSDANCVWAGDAAVTVAVTPPKGTTEVVVLHTDLPDAQSATVAGRRLRLERLEPVPTSARPVERPQYRAFFATSK